MLLFWLLDFTYFKENCKMITTELSKQLVLDVDSNITQQINFIRKLHRAGNLTIFFMIKKAKETILDFSQELWVYCKLTTANPLWFKIISA